MIILWWKKEFVGEKYDIENEKIDQYFDQI